MKSLPRTIFRNSALSMAAQFAIKLLSFAFSVLIVRHLGAETFGQYAAILAYGAMFVFLADLGLSPSAVRAIARLRDTPDGPARIRALYADVLSLRVLLSILAAILIVLAAWLTRRPLLMVGAIALNGLTLVVYGVQGASEAVLVGCERLDLTSGAKVGQQAAFVVLGGLAMVLGLGYYGLVLANLAGVCLLAWMVWRAAQRLGLRPGAAARRNWPALLRAGLPFGLITFALGLSYKFDTVLLNVFRGDAETGYYSAAYNLVFSTIVISNAINTSLYPSLSRAAVASPHTLLRAYERVLRYLLVISVPIAVGGCLLADQLVHFLFGAEYAPAGAALRFVIWAVPLMFLSEFLGYMVVIGNREGKVARAVVVSTAVNVSLNLLLVPSFGLLAAAAMTVITELILVAQHAWNLRALLKQLDLPRALLRPLLAGALMGLGTVAMRGLPLAANIALSAALYAALVFGLGLLGRDELRFIRTLRREPEATGSR